MHGYQRIDPDLVLPQVPPVYVSNSCESHFTIHTDCQVRAAIEAWCDLVAQGKAEKDTVVQVRSNISNLQERIAE